MPIESIPTTERLARALEAAGAPQDMIARARGGYYDDFKSQEIFPIRTLVEHANLHSLYDIAERAKQGEFDGTKEEGDEWMCGPEGQAIAAEFLRETEHRPRPKNPYSSKKRRRR